MSMSELPPPRKMPLVPSSRPGEAGMTTRERATILALIESWRRDVQQMLDTRTKYVQQQERPTQRDLIELARLQARVDTYASVACMITALP